MAYTAEQRRAKELEKEQDLQNNSGSENKPEIKAKKPVKTKVDIPLNTMVEVRNGCMGELTYICKDGNIKIFRSFGDEDYIELADLVNCRNKYPKMFAKNWLMMDDEYLEFLNVSHYYKNALDIDEFDTIFDLSVVDMETKLKELSDGQKRGVCQRAYELIENKTLDSMAKIECIEKTLNVELIER